MIIYGQWFWKRRLLYHKKAKFYSERWKYHKVNPAQGVCPFQTPWLPLITFPFLSSLVPGKISTSRTLLAPWPSRSSSASDPTLSTWAFQAWWRPRGPAQVWWDEFSSRHRYVQYVNIYSMCVFFKYLLYIYIIIDVSSCVFMYSTSVHPYGNMLKLLAVDWTHANNIIFWYLVFSSPTFYPNKNKHFHRGYLQGFGPIIVELPREEHRHASSSRQSRRFQTVGFLKVPNGKLLSSDRKT